MDEDSLGRSDGQAHTVRDAVADLNALDVERTDGEDVAGTHRMQDGSFQQFVLPQLFLHEGQREAGGVDGDGKLPDEKGNGPDVILMAVGDHQARTLLRFSRR